MKLRQKTNAFLSKSLEKFHSRIDSFLNANIYVGKCKVSVPDNSIILFPCEPNTLNCGLAGIVSFKGKHEELPVDTRKFHEMINRVSEFTFSEIKSKKLDVADNYLGGNDFLNEFQYSVQILKRESLFVEIFTQKETFNEITNHGAVLKNIIEKESHSLFSNMGVLDQETVNIVSGRIETLKDIWWCMESEILESISSVKDLITRNHDNLSDSMIISFKKVNAVLNSIDRLEVRGRDSAGISLMFVFDKPEFERFRETLYKASLNKQLKERSNRAVLSNNGISIHDSVDNNGQMNVTIVMTYKVAAEIGSLGDNVSFLRNQIKNDQVLQILTNFQYKSQTVTAHTRWASVGSISDPNCHPVDNETGSGVNNKPGIIHVCLNGDIDNYLELKEEFENRWNLIPEDITTDTKIIPLQIESYLKSGHEISEAFLMAVNDFEGSHAISMQTDLAPGKVFLSQRGSGQAIFVGVADDHYLAASEVYGFVEESPYYLKMDGEKIVEGKSGKTQGQIFVLDQNSGGGLDGIEACYYDGTTINLTDDDIKYTEITSRDIDRQNFPHYFLKEISESPVSVEKTLLNRWKIKDKKNNIYATELDETVIPKAVVEALKNDTIKRIFFMGQGTAGIAAQACADILNHYINDPHIQISALKASELSGFLLKDDDMPDALEDTLIIAISQSGSTTDTNRTVDMVRERGAKTLAIVNRRDSDLTFKVQGVIYTSSGRDIEMSVASTKAFYSQITAGAILGLHISSIKSCRDEKFISDQITELINLPDHMRKVLSMKEEIEESARRLSVTKTYWAAVGSGPNKSSADEIRIKLSELCYKTISSDYVEDKKHIDLSSEPLIIVCAAGTRGNVIGDIVKDTAIFHAHKATPVVIADEGESRFDLYAESVFHVPKVSSHFAPIINTLAGHIWGYYAALSINEGSEFLYKHREQIQNTVDEFSFKGLDIYEIILEKSFRESIAKFYNELRIRRRDNKLPTVMGLNTASDLTLLLKYLAGRLPVSDFELDFGKKGTPGNMLDTLFECINDSINDMARPVDAIKHQAKTVTVGTSRITEKIEGLLFEALEDHKIKVSQLSNSNVIVLKNLQGVISEIKGSVHYSIYGLNLLGEPVETTEIEVLRKDGVLKDIPSRVESDSRLKGSKKIIVREGNVFIGRGLKDGRSTLIIPVYSENATDSRANVIDQILSLNVGFKNNKIPLFAKIKALGGKHERIRNIIQENNIQWDDKFLDILPIEDLFGLSAEKIVEAILPSLEEALNS